MSNIIKELRQISNPQKAKILARFFKTGKGEYGEGDRFLGVTVPESRKIARKYSDTNFTEIKKLLKNEYHEVRLVALLILVHKYRQSISPRSDLGEIKKKEIVNFYLKNTKYINNWDLVDLSAHYILGDYLLNKKKLAQATLSGLAKSNNLWERRIAIVSTFAFIYNKESGLTFKIVKILMKDKEDLIHKACGWMLREVGKKVSDSELKGFLTLYSPQMPRTMLRYAIERLPETERQYYLKR